MSDDDAFIARQPELAALTAARERARAAGPVTVLIGGEAGIGKSRLVTEFTAALPPQTLVSLGPCLELGADGLPFAPFVAAMRQLVRALGPERAAAMIPGGGRYGLAQWLPVLGASGPAEPGERTRLFEDDPSSRELLLFLASNLTQPGVLVIVTYRTNDLSEDHPLPTLLASLRRLPGTQWLTPGPFGLHDVRSLLAARLGREPPAAMVREIHRRAAGNPLFIGALAEAGPGAGTPLPLRDLLLAGFRRLPDDSRQVVPAAAVAGDPVSHELLAAVAGLPGAELERALRPAVAARVLHVSGELYHFQHALVRAAVAEDLLPPERVRLHVRAAQALEAGPGLLPFGRTPTELAAHWHAAGDPRRAIRTAWQAARTAAAQACVGAGEPERGIDLATRALAEVAADPERSAGLLELRSMMQHRVGENGLADLRAGVALLPAEPPSATRGRLLATLANRLMLHSVLPEAADRAAQALTAGRALGDVFIQSWALLTQSALADLSGDLARGSRLRAEADELMAGRPEPEVAHPLILIRMAEAETLDCTGEHEQALRVATDGARLAERLGRLRDTGSVVLSQIGVSLAALGRWDEARDAHRRALAADPPALFRAVILTRLAALDLAQGQPAVARDTIVRARGLLSDGYSGVLYRIPQIQLHSEAAAALGQEDQARQLLAEALALADLADHPQQAWPLLVWAVRLCGEAGPELRVLAGRLDVIGPLQDAHRLTFEASAGAGASWVAAIGAWRALGQPYELACALFAAAGQGGDGAAEGLREAAELARELGATSLLDGIERLARRSRLSLEPPSAADRLGLTPRELEVLRLVADGRSNRQIAETLFISAKTAGVHVSNILAKTGAASRTEAAAVAHRLRLAEP